MTKLGMLIRKERKAKGYSQKTLAELVDDHRQNILNLEAGRLKPSNELLKRLSKILDIKYERLIAFKLLDTVDSEIMQYMYLELQDHYSQGKDSD